MVGLREIDPHRGLIVVTFLDDDYDGPTQSVQNGEISGAKSYVVTNQDELTLRNADLASRPTNGDYNSTETKGAHRTRRVRYGSVSIIIGLKMPNNPSGRTFDSIFVSASVSKRCQCRVLKVKKYELLNNQTGILFELVLINHSKVQKE